VTQPVTVFLLRNGETSLRAVHAPFRGEFETIPLPAGTYQVWASRKTDGSEGPPPSATTVVLGDEAAVDVVVVLAD
jgi:hypothetical protein